MNTIVLMIHADNRVTFFDARANAWHQRASRVPAHVLAGADLRARTRLRLRLVDAGWRVDGGGLAKWDEPSA